MILVEPYQIAFSTADEEGFYFSGDPVIAEPHPISPLPGGTYRVVDGVLYRVFPGPAPLTIGVEGPPAAR